MWDEMVGPSETVLVYEFLIMSGHIKNRTYIETNQVYYYILRDKSLKENYYLKPWILKIQERINELEKLYKNVEIEEEN